MENLLHIVGNNLNDVLPDIYSKIFENGIGSSPRGQDVLEYPSPVVIELLKHDTPWTFFPGRRLNPYFAVAEVIWILAGRNDVEFISYYNQNMKNFSNNGTTFDGAYGSRLRNFPMFYEEFENGKESIKEDCIDQFYLLIRRLQVDPDTRQAVLCIWNPVVDLASGSKDYPCNNMMYFSLRNGILDMSLMRRSNDMIWGLPYNQIQFYFIHALIAGSLGVKMGRYFEFIENMHVYQETYPTLFDLAKNNLEGAREFSKKLVTENSVNRIITLSQFEEFKKIFFASEKDWRMNPNLLTLDAVKIVVIKMITLGIPEYWIKNMFMLPIAYIAKKNGMKDLHDELLIDLESGLKWLVHDFCVELGK